MRPALSHAIPREHRSTTSHKPHDSKGSVSNSEMLSWELHATFARLHPLWSITPDQWVLHPIRAGASSLMGCTTRSATSSVARRTTCSFNTDAEHTAPDHFTGPRSPTRATIAHPMQTDRRATMTMYVSIRQSADPLSKISRKSGNFGEWVCGLADEPTGHHYACALHPTHPTPGNQNDHTQACYQVVLHHLGGITPVRRWCNAP